jgi:hypothetical protein
MNRRTSTALVLLALLSLPACGTVNGARWAYGASSAYGKPEGESDALAFRATLAVPVILGGVAFDAVTFPFQIAFGAWPWWGDASRQMKPTGT